MLGKTLGYCAYCGYGSDISLRFFEKYKDAVEVLREFVLELSELPSDEIKAMHYIELMCEIQLVDEESQEHIFGDVYPIRFEQRRSMTND